MSLLVIIMYTCSEPPPPTLQLCPHICYWSYLRYLNSRDTNTLRLFVYLVDWRYPRVGSGNHTCLRTLSHSIIYLYIHKNMKDKNKNYNKVGLFWIFSLLYGCVLFPLSFFLLWTFFLFILVSDYIHILLNKCTWIYVKATPHCLA